VEVYGGDFRAFNERMKEVSKEPDYEKNWRKRYTEVAKGYGYTSELF
jgi:hypothetical protein